MSASGYVLSRRAAIALALPALALLVFFFALPIIGILRSSFQTFVPGIGATETFTISNYVDFITDSYYLHIFFTTVILSILATAVAALIGFLVAYWIVKSPRWLRSAALAAIILPSLVSDVVRSYGWTIFFARNGLLQQMAGLVGISVPSVMYTKTAVVIGLASILLPFLVLPTIASMAAIPDDLEDAARSLGSGGTSVLIRIVFPLALPGFLVGCALVFILSMGAFVAPSLMGGPTVPVMGTLIYDKALSSNNVPFSSASGLILLSAILLLVVAVGTVIARRMRRAQ